MLRLATLLAVVGAAFAYNRPEQVKEFHKIDVDASGHVDRSEVDGHLDRQFVVRTQPRAAAAQSPRYRCPSGTRHRCFPAVSRHLCRLVSCLPPPPPPPAAAPPF